MISAKDVREKQLELYKEKFRDFEIGFENNLAENPYAKSFTYSIKKEHLDVFVEMLEDAGYKTIYDPPSRFLEYVEVTICW